MPKGDGESRPPRSDNPDYSSRHSYARVGVRGVRARPNPRFELPSLSLPIFVFKGCPRCGGDTHIDRDIYGGYTYCVQCGWYKDGTRD